MENRSEYFWESDVADSALWDAWRAGFLPGVRCSGYYLREVEVIPDGWGIAWWEIDRDEALIMPIPFNWLWSFGRRVKRFLKLPPWRAYDRTLWHRAFLQGYEKGYDEGFTDGRSGKII